MAKGARAFVAAVALVLAPTLAVGCSSDGSDGSSATTSTVPGAGVDPTTTVAGDPDITTTVVEVPTTPTTEPVEGEPFTGTLGNEGGTAAELSFVRTDGALRNVTIRGLEVTCHAIEGTDDSPTQVVDLVLPEVPVAADGSVEYTDPSNPWQPALRGMFNDEGRFLGSIFLNLEADGKVCGGDIPLDLAP